MFDLLTTFDYPGGTDTYAAGINDRGDVTGYFNDPTQSFLTRGYVRFANGRFSPRLRNNNANYGDVYPTGINNLRILCGYWPGGDFTHGFVYSNGAFTDVLVGSTNTFVTKINDAGNFCGYTQNPDEGFVSIAGVLTRFTIPGAIYTYATGINNLDQVVGTYVTYEHYYGFRREADGTFIYPIDVPGAATIYLFAINDDGQMVGFVTDDRVQYHAIAFPTPHQFAVYDHPDATIYTDFEGINNQGQICGRYFDGTANHGFIVKVRPAADE